VARTTAIATTQHITCAWTINRSTRYPDPHAHLFINANCNNNNNRIGNNNRISNNNCTDINIKTAARSNANRPTLDR
jgi:hypothetical protein